MLVLIGTTVTCRQPAPVPTNIKLPPTGDAGLLPAGNAQPPRTGNAGLLDRDLTGWPKAGVIVALTMLALGTVAAARVYAGRGR